MYNYIFISIKYNINFPKEKNKNIWNLNKDCSTWNFYKLFVSPDPLIASNKAHVFLRIA